VDLEYQEPLRSKMVFNPLENEINITRIMDYLAGNTIFPLR
jgi:bifunctional enzyme CysN/CysC